MTENNNDIIMSKLEFPRIYDKCPVCGCTETIINGLREELKADKKYVEPKNVKVGLPMAAMLPAASVLSLTVPCVRIILDICANPDCGNIYPIWIDKVEIENNPQLQNQQG